MPLSQPIFETVALSPIELVVVLAASTPPAVGCESIDRFAAMGSVGTWRGAWTIAVGGGVAVAV